MILGPSKSSCKQMRQLTQQVMKLKRSLGRKQWLGTSSLAVPCWKVLTETRLSKEATGLGG